FQSARFIDVANGDNVGSPYLIDQTEQILAALAGPDGSHANPIVRAQNAAVRSGAGKGGAHEDTAIGFADFDRHGRTLNLQATRWSSRVSRSLQNARHGGTSVSLGP